MKKVILSFIIFNLILSFSCSSDDDNPEECPEVIEIVTQEDLELAERCGLEPAEPLGKIWVRKK